MMYGVWGGCLLWLMLASMAHAEDLPIVEYSAVQTIETTPGPFVNHIYVSKDKERQDAHLGGHTITTIIRRDQQVAWLLNPHQQRYQEVTLDQVNTTSVQQLFLNYPHQLEEQNHETQLSRYRVDLADGGEPALMWVDPHQIVIRAQLPAHPRLGRAAAEIRLDQVQIQPQDPNLFELPKNYQKMRD